MILGIDPGSRVTGFGLIEVNQKTLTYVDAGCIVIPPGDWSARLACIFSGVEDIIKQYQPTEAAIEQVFMHRNASSALKLGQARGAAMVAVSRTGISLAEYSARQIKQAVVGYGAASKTQVIHMVTQLLTISTALKSDAADALAIAICHANCRGANALLSQGYGRRRRGRKR